MLTYSFPNGFNRLPPHWLYLYKHFSCYSVIVLKFVNIAHLCLSDDFFVFLSSVISVNLKDLLKKKKNFLISQHTLLVMFPTEISKIKNSYFIHQKSYNPILTLRESKSSLENCLFFIIRKGELDGYQVYLMKKKKQKTLR